MNAALQTLQPLVRPGGMMLLLSDFSNFDERCELQLATIAARSDCRLLWLTDPLEASGLPRGQYRLGLPGRLWRSEEHTSELQSLMRISYAVFCLQKKKNKKLCKPQVD